MNRIAWILSAVSLLTASSVSAQKEISLEDIYQKGTFRSNWVSGFNFLKDGEQYSKMEYSPKMASIATFDLASGQQTSLIFEGSQLAAIPGNEPFFGGYEFSEDEQKMLIETQTEQIYRHSTRASFFIYDIATKKLAPVSDKGKQRLATFSPDASKVAFVRKNNLFIKTIASGDEIQFTNDGKDNAIINGAADWVYEEEFSFTKAFEWSPDGKKIAFMRFDESAVPEFTMTFHDGGLYPKYSTFKYPKAGEKNATLSIHIYDLETKKTVKADLGTETDIYFPRIKWSPDSHLIVFKMNRHQNELELLKTNPETGKTSLLLAEKNKYYIDIHDNLTFLKDGRFIWTSEQDGFNHIYIYTADGKMDVQLTKGDYDVTNFYGVDEEDGRVYYQAAAENAMSREVYQVNLKGKKNKKLSSKDGTNDAQWSRTFEYCVLRHSSLNEPYSWSVINDKGKEVRQIEGNDELVGKVNEYGFSKASFFKMKTSEDVELNGWMIKPTNFDENKQYPVFMYCYGGPGSQTANNSWGRNRDWFEMLAQKGYIVVSVDNRGTGARGEEFKKSTYKQLGALETIDQIEAAKWLGKQKYVDASRIGIFGWSFGGYLSSLCILKGNDVFKAAIAVAPVTNWKWYDTIYTERFLRTPAENTSGYEDNSPVNYADKLKGAYLLCHGDADDNVHVQNTLEMTNALIAANKQFDTYIYPNRNHGIYGGGATLHLYTKMTNFIIENL